MNPSISNDNEEKEIREKHGLLDRLKFWFVSLMGYWAISLIGRTLRWESEGMEYFDAATEGSKRAIFVFWHGRIFMGSYLFRHRGIVVLTSQARDGEYITRVIRRLGYGAVRGSASRGQRRALAEIMRELQRKHHHVAITIDGPRGPRYVAKPGAVWLASKTGHPIIPLSLSAEKKWVLKSWDHFNIPKPFSRAFMVMEAPIYVKQDATEEEMAEVQQLIQRALEDLLERGDSHWHRSKAE